MIFFSSLVLFISIIFIHIPTLLIKNRQNFLIANFALFASYTFNQILMTFVSYINLISYEKSTIFYSFLVSYSFFCNALLFFLIIKLKVYRYFSLTNFKGILNKQKINGFSIKIFYFGLFLLVLIMFLKSPLILTSPRLFYQTQRSGIGFIWAFYASSIGFILPLVIFQRFISQKKVNIYSIKLLSKTNIKLYLVVIVTLLLANSTGSKAIILGVFLQAFCLIFYFHRRFSRKIFFLIGIPCILLLGFNFFSSIANISFERVLIYANTAWGAGNKFYEDLYNGNFDFFNGKMFLTNFYSFIPRAIFPDKPYSYGSLLLLDKYYPGQSATGHTFSLGYSSNTIGDFGLFWGPIFNSFLNPRLITKLISISLLTVPFRFLSPLGFILLFSCGTYTGFSFHIPIFLYLPIFFLTIKSIYYLPKEKKI